MVRDNSLILDASLQTFFFDQLQSVNQKSQIQLPNEVIYYSSLVMDKFGHSHEYFEVVDGRVREKVLGMKLLESSHLSAREQQRQLKDVGDTALILCGFFSDSINERKLLDIKYYREIGQAAYLRLNSFVPSFYDVDSFYKGLSGQFDILTRLMQVVQRTHLKADESDVHLIINKNLKVS